MATELAYQSGFGNGFETEALSGALPIGRNSPQKCAYGLYAERLWCINGVGDRVRPLCLCSGDLPGDRHAEAGHAVDHLAGDPGFDLLRGQSPGPEAPADQNLVPMESRFHECPLAIASCGLPAHSALLRKQLDVPVALSWLSLCGVAEDRV